MITITGATGQLGSGVIEHLIQKGLNPANITALARNEEKAQALKEKGVNIKIGDYDNYSALVAAFEGTDKLLFISSSDLENRDKQQINVVKAAKEAGVRHILYTSIQRQSDSPDSPIAFVSNSHLATENAIKESGMRYTLLQNNLYMDILPWILGEQVFDKGVFYPAQEGKIAFTLRSDIAEATANILMGDDHEDKVYNISNSHSLSFREVAEHLSIIAGKPVNYFSPGVEEYKSALTGAGAPQMVADMLAGFAAGIAQGELIAGDTDLPTLLGREAVSYKAYLSDLYAKK
ncbi:NAD(P)H dehydrogenase (quinone) [Reichenbachiella agariperforans]|uniref:NAD(P)H dehydrogenase (Quinone) n=1 Tax=Reichenbachiella agariperforans TaxID=156994 RepID=A0A1M6SZQ5_REIAG|nr:SDR family oxidoreductase [Reichenbachiella agariperforans]SHK50181.1 NAD(P)H dehydrogenase (quinone) [Reichenbachiella agariperforans]